MPANEFAFGILVASAPPVLTPVEWQGSVWRPAQYIAEVGGVIIQGLRELRLASSPLTPAPLATPRILPLADQPR